VLVIKSASRYLYPAALLLSAVLIWYNVALAHQLPYDDNFGAIVFAMIFSMVITLSVALMWFLKKVLILQNKFMSLAFLILASPVTILIFIFVCEKMTGSYFKTG